MVSCAKESTSFHLLLSESVTLMISITSEFDNLIFEYFSAFPNVNFYFDPLANDAGTSLGAAKYYWHKTTNDKSIRPLKSLYLGHE